MKNLSILISTPNYSGGLKFAPIILFAPATYNAGYPDIVDGLTLPSGSAVDVTTSTINILGGNIGRRLQFSGGQVKNVITTDQDSFTEITDLTINGEPETRNVLNKEALDINEGKGITTVVGGSSFGGEDIILQATSTPTSLVTDVTGGGSSGSSTDVEYLISGDLVKVGGSGYKKFLNGLYSKKRFIDKIRFTVSGSDDLFTDADVLGLQSFIIDNNPESSFKNIFSLSELFTPRQKALNIVDFYPLQELDENVAFVFGSYFSATVTYKIAVWYK
tara:strand:+ start:327 stop:1154 length:828 start_codon:yes stop_codon:yes gene_type:complete